MKTTKCDKCGVDGRSYRYSKDKSMDPSGNGYNKNWIYIDLCFECLNTFILKNGVKLSEVVSSQPSSNKGIIHG